MVKVLKRDKSLEGFKAAKIVRSCKRAGMPEPIAKTIASMISKKIKNRKVVKSMDIMKMVFEICKKIGKVPVTWKKHEKIKRARKAKMKAAKRKPAKRKPARGKR